MPEFILDHGSPEAARAFRKLDSFTQGYVEAMFFTDTGTGDDGDLQNASFAELAPSTLDSIIADCEAFQRITRRLLDVAYERGYEEEQAGRDFWFTRNGHGVGFWDRRVLEAGSLGDRLSKYCGWDSRKRKHPFHELDVCRGDDGLIYCE